MLTLLMNLFVVPRHLIMPRRPRFILVSTGLCPTAKDAAAYGAGGWYLVEPGPGGWILWATQEDHDQFYG